MVSDRLSALEYCNRYWGMMIPEELLPTFALEYPVCENLYRIIGQDPNARCRTPCAILYEFVSKVGYEVDMTCHEFDKATPTSTICLFEVTLALRKVSGDQVGMLQKGTAAKKKTAKQLAAIKHIESILYNVPSAMPLFLNRLDRRHMPMNSPPRNPVAQGWNPAAPGYADMQHQLVLDAASFDASVPQPYRVPLPNTQHADSRATATSLPLSQALHTSQALELARGVRLPGSGTPHRTRSLQIQWGGQPARSEAPYHLHASTSAPTIGLGNYQVGPEWEALLASEMPLAGSSPTAQPGNPPPGKWNWQQVPTSSNFPVSSRAGPPRRLFDGPLHLQPSRR